MAGLGTVVDLGIERIVKAAFSKLDRNFQPSELERELKTAMKLCRTEFLEGSYVPNKFVIFLSRADYDSFSPLKKQIIEDLVVCVSEYVQQSGNKILGDKRKKIEEKIIIDLRSNNKLSKGMVKIEPSFLRV